MNLYGYVYNDPINLIDFFGLESYGLYYDRNGNWAYPHGLPKPRPIPPPPSNPIEAGTRLLGRYDYSSYPSQFLLSPPSWWFNPQCNRFIGDCVSQCPKYPSPKIDDGEGGKRYPTASEWGDPNIDIPGWGSPHTNPKPGDVVTGDGHLGFMTETGYLNAPTMGPVRVLPFNNPKWNPGIGRSPQ